MSRPRAAWMPGALALLVLIAAVAAVVAHRRAEPAASSSVGNSSVLVLTWAPSLCKVESAAPGCRSGRVDKHGESFLLHGLWPQPRDRRYCGVPARERDRRPVELPRDLQDQLSALMSDSTSMTEHEWYAHGSCSGVTPTEYFSVVTRLTGQAIEVLDPVFDRAAGGGLASRSVRAAFENRFGTDAGARVSLSCREASGVGRIVYEVRLSLPPVAQLVPETPALADALADAPAVPPGCGQAKVP